MPPMYFHRCSCRLFSAKLMNIFTKNMFLLVFYQHYLCLNSIYIIFLLLGKLYHWRFFPITNMFILVFLTNFEYVSTILSGCFLHKCIALDRSCENDELFINHPSVLSDNDLLRFVNEKLDLTTNII